MFIRFIARSELDYLKVSAGANIQHYTRPESWLDHFFEESTWERQSSISYQGFSLYLPEKGNNYDFENTKIIYSHLGQLKPAQAGDERLWAYMTHVSFWDYMRLRWPVENTKNPLGRIQERYFFIPNRDRALVLNGISRLWWYGYASVDYTRTNPFELTSILLERQDLAQSLLERTFSRSRTLTMAVLEAVYEYKQESGAIPKRESFRDAMKSLNQLGGTVILDCLAPEYIKNVMLDWMRKGEAVSNDERSLQNSNGSHIPHPSSMKS